VQNISGVDVELALFNNVQTPALTSESL